MSFDSLFISFIKTSFLLSILYIFIARNIIIKIFIFIKIHMILWALWLSSYILSKGVTSDCVILFIFIFFNYYFFSNQLKFSLPYYWLQVLLLLSYSFIYIIFNWLFVYWWFTCSCNCFLNSEIDILFDILNLLIL